jgi:pullulanase
MTRLVIKLVKRLVKKDATFRFHHHGWLFLCSLLAFMAGCSGDGDGNATTDSILVEPAANQAVIYYKRADGDYNGWGLHLWEPSGATFKPDAYLSATGTEWTNPLPAAGVSQTYGAYYIVNLGSADWTGFNFIMHNGDNKDLGGLDHSFVRSTMGNDLFTFAGNGTLFPDPLENAPVTIEGAKAHWITDKVIAFNAGGTVRLHYSDTAAIELDATSGELTGGTAVELTSTTVTDAIRAAFPHLAAYAMWTVPDSVDTKAILKQQLIVTDTNASARLTAATKVQTRGALDAIYATAAGAASLGATTAGTTTFALWAPTARDVSVLLYDSSKTLVSTHPMTEDAASGVWTFASSADETGNFYRFKVTVYHYLLDSVETFTVTDPGSLSLSTNSEYSQVVDLDDGSLMPADWVASGADSSYKVSDPQDIVVYETHIRDFSASDSAGTPTLNGKYLAYTETDRASVQHLQALKNAGLTHVQVLPAFDIATINEDADAQINLSNTKAELCAVKASASICANNAIADSATIASIMASFDPATGDAQALANDMRELDAFNWGYDPYHYTTPEGSYATDPNGTARILEFRSMVKALHDMGLSVVMDVVYNHTNASGNAEKSVLDKIVPGYYHRLNVDSGAVENSTCCDNTSTESRMFQKLMEDSLVVWARDYQVDSFRFDLMGHHPKQGMLDALAKVRAVRSNVYFYGEGWNFGEVADDARFEQATQANMAGTQIGTFSDRLRDAVRGGGPFDGEDSLRSNQGFANGLYTLPNELSGQTETVKARLLALSDNIRVGMAANLADFVLVDAAGGTAQGSGLDYNGQPTGYAADPADIINYVSKHDNQTLWDINQYKIATGTTTADRVRMQMLGLSLPLLSQGIPFIHMGSDILRSKSMERDSYDSGDWFNQVDFSYARNNWNAGLPNAGKDAANWPLISEILADGEAQPTDADIAVAAGVFQDLLAVRSSSPLFRLRTASDVKSRVDFRNTGPDQIPGVVVMTIDDGTGLADLDPAADALVVVVNASPLEHTVTVDGASGFTLHPLQTSGTDPVVATSVVSGNDFTVPALTSAIFVKTQFGAQGSGLPVTAKDLSAIPPLGSTTAYVRGDMNGWGTTNAMSFSSNGMYATTISLDAGTYDFKIADSGYSAVNFGAADGTVTPGVALTLEFNGGNLSVTLEARSSVTFAVDFSDTSAPLMTVTVTALESCDLQADSDSAGPLSSPLALRGAHSSWNWSTDYQLTYKGNNTYQVAFTNVDLSGGFKLAANTDNWDPQVIAYSGGNFVSSLTVNQSYDAVARIGTSAIDDPGNNTLSSASGTYVLTLVVSTLTDAQTSGTIQVCRQ